jgi:hypothetical protein
MGDSKRSTESILLYKIEISLLGARGRKDLFECQVARVDMCWLIVIVN